MLIVINLVLYSPAKTIKKITTGFGRISERSRRKVEVLLFQIELVWFNVFKLEWFNFQLQEITNIAKDDQVTHAGNPVRWKLRESLC